MDDFSYKKNYTYGTIIVNEEKHEPITLLEGCEVKLCGRGLKKINMYGREAKLKYKKVSKRLNIARIE